MSIKGQIRREQSKARAQVSTAVRRAQRRVPTHVVAPKGLGSRVGVRDLTPERKGEIRGWKKQQEAEIAAWGTMAKREVLSGKPQMVYEGLTAEEEGLLKDYGVEEVMRRRRLAGEKEAVEEFKKENIQLPTGDWVSTIEYEKLDPEVQTELKTRGLKGFNIWVEGENKKAQAEFKEWYGGLPKIYQVKYDELGQEGYNKWFGTTHVEVEPGVHLLSEDWGKFTPEEQKEIKKVGYGSWVDIQQTGYSSYLESTIEIEPDLRVLKTDWEALPQESKDRIREIGYEAYGKEVEVKNKILEKLEPYKKVYVSKGLFGIPSSIQPLETQYTYDIGQAQVDKVVTDKELESLDLSAKDIKRARYETVVGWQQYIPFWGTGRMWRVYTPGEMALYGGMDLATLLYGIGAVAKAATITTKAATIGMRASIIARTFGRIGLEFVKFPFKAAGGVASAVRHPVTALRLIPSGLKGIAVTTLYPLRHPKLTGRAIGGLLVGSRGLPGPTIAELSSIVGIKRFKLPIKLGYQKVGDVPILDKAGKITGYERTIWRGLSIGERPVFPRSPKTLSITPKEVGPWMPKTPLEARVTMRKLSRAEVKYLRSMAGELGLTPKEAQVIKRAGIIKIPGYAPKQLAKFPAMIPEVKKYWRGFRSPWVRKTLRGFPTTKGLPAEAVATIYDDAARFAEKGGFRWEASGSGMVYQQAPIGTVRPPADIDMIFYAPKSQVDDWARATCARINKLGYAKMRPLITDEVVNLEMWDKALGRWVGVTDIHYLPGGLPLTYTGPEYAFGIKLDEPLVSFKTISGKTVQGWSLAKHAKIKGLGSLTMGLELGEIGPIHMGRMKDITDFIAYTRLRGHTTTAKAIAKLYGVSWDDVLRASPMGGEAARFGFGPPPLGTFSPYTVPSSILSKFPISPTSFLSSLGSSLALGSSIPSVIPSPSLTSFLTSLETPPMGGVSALSTKEVLPSMSRFVSPELKASLVYLPMKAEVSSMKDLPSPVSETLPSLSDITEGSPIVSSLKSMPKLPISSSVFSGSFLGYGGPSPKLPPSFPYLPSGYPSSFSRLISPLTSPYLPFPSYGIPPTVPPISPIYGPLTSPLYPPYYPHGGKPPPMGGPPLIPPISPPPIPIIPHYPRGPEQKVWPITWRKEDREEGRTPSKLPTWQQGFIKKVVESGKEKPTSIWNPVPKGEGKPSETFRYAGEGTPIPGAVDLGVVDIKFSKRGIEFEGGGLETDVGKRHPSKTKGWSPREQTDMLRMAL